MTDWSKMVYVQEQTAMWKVKFQIDVHGSVLKCESNAKDYFCLIF